MKLAAQEQYSYRAIAQLRKMSLQDMRCARSNRPSSKYMRWTKAVITTPELEMQGANLTFECILQDLNMYLDESGIKKLRNLYVQLDNVSSNKSYTLAAAFAALIYLDMRMKVKVPYLEVIGFYT
jgi:hypothetical protein